jgi:hypothetical protein
MIENDAEKISFNTHFFKIIGIAWLLIFVIGAALLPYVSKLPTQYDEFIVTDNTVYNKANELRLFWFCTAFACVAVIAMDVLLFRKGRTRLTASNLPVNREVFGFFCISILPNIALIVITGSTKPMLLLVALLYAAARHLAKEQALKIVLLLAYLYYALLSLLVIVNTLNIIKTNYHNYGPFAQDFFNVFVFFVALGVLVFVVKTQNYAKLDKLLLYMQFPIPLIFANNLISRYIYQDQMYYLPFAPTYYIYYVAIIVALSLWNVASYKKVRASAAPKDAEYIFPSTFVTIFAFNSYYYPAKLLQDDFWHFGENMLSWHQIVGQGRTAYQEYIPPSGFYAMVDGFFQNVLLTGMVTDYQAAMNMSMTLFAIIVIVLCYYNSSAKTALLVAVCTGLPMYNREHMILPVALTLMLPKLARNANAWLQVWIVLGLLGVLYYPLYGAAVAVGMAPFAVLQFVCLVKNKNLLAKLLKEWRFYASWLVVLSIIAFSAPLIFRILANLRIMSSQTLLTDGINIMQARYAPYQIFPYINSSFVRFLAYCGMRFSLPAIVVTAFVYLIYVFICNNRKNLRSYDTAAMLAKLAMVPILLVISYTFTLVRAEIWWLLSRTSAPILAACFIALVLFSVAKNALAYMTQKLVICAAISFLLLSTSLFPLLNFPAPLLSSHQVGGFTDDIAKLKSAYVISFDGNNELSPILITSAAAEAVPLLGEGFGLKKSINALVDISAATENIREHGYTVTGTTYLAYYAADLRTSGSPALGVIRSKPGQLYLIQQYESDRPVFLHKSDHPILLGLYEPFYFNSVRHYYIFRWIIDNDYLLLGDWYVPREKAALLENEGKATDFLNARNEAPLALDFTPSELGNSLDSLKHLFVAGREMDIKAHPENAIGLEGHKIVFGNAIAGRDYDALYLELENRNPEAGSNTSFGEKLISYYGPKKIKNSTLVTINWKTADGLTGGVSGLYGDGKLLFLLGANSTWLLSENTEISIHLAEGYAEAEAIYVKKACLMSVLLE